CLGMQLATIEFARNVCGLAGANSTEFDPDTPHPVVALITEWLDRTGRIEKRTEKSDLGGTMRLGAQKCPVEPGTLAFSISGLERPLFLIAGPCVVESRELQIEVAGKLKEITGKLGIPFIFKSSYDKANRSSGKSFRGLGMDQGLKILSEVKRQIGVPVLTDV